ncbi:MAG: hypothetical protein OXM88_04250, partial [bacterium]|nr:hypothetical protein [bacterium]
MAETRIEPTGAAPGSAEPGASERRFSWRITGRWVGITGLLAFLVAPIVPLFIWSISFRWFYPAILP